MRTLSTTHMREPRALGFSVSNKLEDFSLILVEVYLVSGLSFLCIPMATPIKQTRENRNAKRASVSISGPAYTVAVGGASRGSKPKTKNHETISKRTFGAECRITSRYLRPSTGSCHDLCKHGVKDESLEPKNPVTRFGSRRMSVIKNKGVKKTVVSNEPVEVIKLQNSRPLKKIEVSKGSLLKNRKSTQNELKSSKNHMKKKSVSSTSLNGSAQLTVCKSRVTPKVVNHTGSFPRNSKLVSPPKDQNKMTKNKSKQLITKKVTEMKKLPPPSVTTELTDLPSSESCQFSSNEQVLEEEHEDPDNEEVILSEVDCEMVTSEGNSNYRVIICEDRENGGLTVKFKTGNVVEVQSEINGPRKLKFRRGEVVKHDCKDRWETVTLKHQEMQEKKKVQELLNRVIEETANKLVVDRKTKVEALVGAFESIISLQDELLHTSS